MTRLSLLPHVFVAVRRRAGRPTAYVSGRALRAAIAANAAVMTFAGDAEARREPGGHDPFAAPAHATDTAPGHGSSAEPSDAAHAPNAALAHVSSTPPPDAAHAPLASPTHAAAAPAPPPTSAPAHAAVPPAPPPTSAPTNSGRDVAA